MKENTIMLSPVYIMHIYRYTYIRRNTFSTSTWHVRAYIFSHSLLPPTPWRSSATMPPLALWRRRPWQPSGWCLHLEGRRGSIKGGQGYHDNVGYWLLACVPSITASICFFCVQVCRTSVGCQEDWQEVWPSGCTQHLRSLLHVLCNGSCGFLVM